MLGAICFASCALPQVIKALKTKSTNDISLFYIILSIFGNIFSAIYIFGTNYISGYWQWPQYFNYGTALTLIIILLVIKRKYDK
ncbi:MAG: PQ-loop repeat-containing protein [Methanobrevibacter sp.]|nr:PQ-loop repeat-containing protein [Methanobrevibacter sp.]